MERKIADYLLKWKNSPNRMPLILYGARQVGKTYAALTSLKYFCENAPEYEDFSPLSLHETAMELYRSYLVVGGMPRAVLEYTSTYDFNFVVAAQKSLNDAYIANMAKYATPQETTKIMAAWASVPAQLAKENHKFQYKVIKSGARLRLRNAAGLAQDGGDHPQMRPDQAGQNAPLGLVNKL